MWPEYTEYKSAHTWERRGMQMAAILFASFWRAFGAFILHGQAAPRSCGPSVCICVCHVSRHCIRAIHRIYRVSVAKPSFALYREIVLLSSALP